MRSAYPGQRPGCRRFVEIIQIILIEDLIIVRILGAGGRLLSGHGHFFTRPSRLVEEFPTVRDHDFQIPIGIGETKTTVVEVTVEAKHHFGDAR